MDWLVALIGGLGIGSLLKGVVDHVLTTRSKADDRVYQEKREIYFGLIEAMHQSDIQPSMENAKAFGNWFNRCKLFGSPEVIAAAQAYIDTSADVTSKERAEAFDALFVAMREDIRK